MSLNITVNTQRTGHFQIDLDGKLDTETYIKLEKAFTGIFSPAMRSLVLDMKNLTYVSSMGLRVLMKITKDMRVQKGELVVINASPSISAVLDIAKALPSFSIFSSMAEADAYLANIQQQNK